MVADVLILFFRPFAEICSDAKVPGKSEAEEATLLLLGDQTQLSQGARDRGKCSRPAWNFPREPTGALQGGPAMES